MSEDLQAWLTGKRIWTWSPFMENTSKIFIGRREIGILVEAFHVVVRDGGWTVSLSNDLEGVSYNWVLSADGYKRRVDDPRTRLFTSQADAIVAAVCRLEFYRRVSHPTLLDARRRQFDGDLDPETNDVLNLDIWNDETMALLDFLWVTDEGSNRSII